MPKMKTKKAAAKRLRVRKGGTIKHGSAGNRHNTGKKRSKVGRRLRGSANLDKSDISKAIRTMPYRNKSR